MAAEKLYEWMSFIVSVIYLCVYVYVSFFVNVYIVIWCEAFILGCWQVLGSPTNHYVAEIWIHSPLEYPECAWLWASAIRPHWLSTTLCKFMLNRQQFRYPSWTLWLQMLR